MSKSKGKSDCGGVTIKRWVFGVLQKRGRRVNERREFVVYAATAREARKRFCKWAEKNLYLDYAILDLVTTRVDESNEMSIVTDNRKAPGA